MIHSNKLLLLFCSAFLLLSNPSKAQNLVPDSSFEAVTNHFCGILTSSAQFNSLFTFWSNPTLGGDQYSMLVDTTCYNHCTNPSPQGPIPPKGFQAPRNGDVFPGIFLYTIPTLEQREYIQTELTSPLVIGESYAVSAWVSLADYSENATSSLDFLLTTLPVGGNVSTLYSYTPQTAHTTLLSSTTDWMQVIDTIVVDSAYQYLTIGNFMEDSATVLSPNPGSGGGPGQYGSYYFIEDVSVSLVSPTMNTLDQLEIPQAQLPGTITLSKNQVFSPTYPLGGETLTFSIYNINGQVVYRGEGVDASWRANEKMTGIYVWNLEWMGGSGGLHVQQGKVLVME